MLRITKNTFLLATTLLTIALMAPYAAAHKNHDHSKAEGVLRERLDFMENMGKATGGLMAVVRGKKEFDPKEVMANVDIIQEQSGEALTRLFPENSNEGISEALSNIWTDWDGFVKVAGALGTKAEALTKAMKAAGNDEAAQKMALQKNMRNIGGGCRDCHSEYRKKQKKD